MENAVSIAKGIVKVYGIAVHAETVRRSEKKNNGLNCRVASRKLFLRDVRDINKTTKILTKLILPFGKD